MSTRHTLRIEGETTPVVAFSPAEWEALASRLDSVRDPVSTSGMTSACVDARGTITDALFALDRDIGTWSDGIAFLDTRPEALVPPAASTAVFYSEAIVGDIDAILAAHDRFTASCTTPPARRTVSARDLIPYPLTRVVASRPREVPSDPGGKLPATPPRAGKPGEPPSRDDSRPPVYIPPSSGAGMVILVGLGLTALVGGGIWYATRRKR